MALKIDFKMSKNANSEWETVDIIDTDSTFIDRMIKRLYTSTTKEDICVITHTDLDGIIAGHLSWMLDIPRENIHTVNYSAFDKDDSVYKLMENKHVIITDISLNNKTFEKITRTKIKGFWWIDHHCSSVELFKKYLVKEDSGYVYFNTEECNSPYDKVFIKLDTSSCGSKLYYSIIRKQLNDLGYDESHLTEIIDMVNDYDLWMHRYPASNALNEALFTLGSPFPGSNTLNDIFKDRKRYHEIITAGHVIHEYKKSINQCIATWFVKLVTHTFNVGGKDITLNLLVYPGRGNSSIFDSINISDAIDALCVYGYNPFYRNYVYSLYKPNNGSTADILSICKSFGGGGHKQACGFQIKSDLFNLA